MFKCVKALTLSIAGVALATTLTACGSAFDTPYNSTHTSHQDAEPHYNDQHVQTQTEDYDLYEGVVADIDHIIDGDTLAVVLPGEEKTTTVRLIGINTPETKKPNTPVETCGPEATAHMTNLIKNNTQDNKVWVYADPSQEAFDKYNRLLGHVYTYENDYTVKTNIALSQVEQGLAKEFTYGNDYHNKEVYVAAQREAQAKQRGIWNPASRESDCITQ